MTNTTDFTFNDLVFSHDANSLSYPSNPRSHLDDLIEDIETPFTFSSSLDFSLSIDSWHDSICFHFSQLRLSSITPLLSLFHSYHIGQLLHQEDLRLLRRQAPTLIRSRRNGRKVHTKFCQTVQHLPGQASHVYRAARHVFGLYTVLDPQAMQVAQVITPNRLRKMPKEDFTTLYRHAKTIGQGNQEYPHHFSLFIGTTEL